MRISYRSYYLLHQVCGMVHKIGNCSSPTPSIFCFKILLPSRNSYKVLFFYSFMFPCKVFDIEIAKTKYSAMSILSLLLCYFISNQQFCSLNSFTTKNSLISIYTSVWTQLNNWTELIANVSFEKINLRCFKLHPINFSCLGFDRQIIDSFHIAAVRGDFRTVNRLLQDGVPVDVSNVSGYTALHRAARENQTDVAERLLQAGADANKQNINGDTPMHLAALFNSPEVARLLANQGADYTLKNSDNKTPLDCAHDDEIRRLLLEIQ